MGGAGSGRNTRSLVVSSAAMDWKNKLYFGDNLQILRERLPDACVDVIYLDPPFNSNANYNVLFKEKSGEESAAQIMALWIGGGCAGSQRQCQGKLSKAPQATLISGNDQCQRQISRN